MLCGVEVRGQWELAAPSCCAAGRHYTHKEQCPQPTLVWRQGGQGWIKHSEALQDEDASSSLVRKTLSCIVGGEANAAQHCHWLGAGAAGDH